MVSKIIMDKVLALEKLKQEMLDNKKLPLKTNLVFGEGSSDCQVLFIGEAPGAVEDQQVRPFVGRSGQLLRRLGLERRRSVYYQHCKTPAA